MTEAFGQFWQLVWGANTLNPEAFRAIATHPNGILFALATVLLAGLSRSFGQAIVLFLNRVQPLRFLLSLVIAAVLFAASAAFWVLSVWGVGRLLYGVDAGVLTVLKVLGLAYAPLILGFLVALPYLGVQVEVGLTIWSLLTFVRGFGTVAELERWQVLGCALLGWFVLQVVQRTIGRPAVLAGRWLSNSVAGTELITDLNAIETAVQSRFELALGRTQQDEAD